MGGTVRIGGVETIMSYTSLLRVKGQFETVKSSTIQAPPAPAFRTQHRWWRHSSLNQAKNGGKFKLIMNNGMSGRIILIVPSRKECDEENHPSVECHFYQSLSRGSSALIVTFWDLTKTRTYPEPRTFPERTSTTFCTKTRTYFFHSAHKKSTFWF